MRYRLLAAVAATFLAAGLASAQPNEPTIEVRLRSVNDLVDRFEYVAGLAGKEDAVRQVRDLIMGRLKQRFGVPSGPTL